MTIFRPYDHVWHTGLAMTCAQLSGQNFWGGPTHVRGQGYVQLPNNGRIQHVAWDQIQAEAAAVTLCERLQWINSEGELWLAEQRRISVDDIDKVQGHWCLDLAFILTNVHRTPLVCGSPTTEGRPMAGYGGLFWRGPRSFLRGTVLAHGGLAGPEIMGQAAPWLAYIGQHDGTADISTVLFIDDPHNPRFPTKWFVRNDPYAAVTCAFSFDEELTLAPGQDLTLRYRVVVAHGAWSREQLAEYAGRPARR